MADTGRKKFCRWVRLAAQRFLDDLKRAEDPENSFSFDRWHGNDPCDFIEKLPHVEGKWETPTIVLHASHIFFLVNLFGFRGRDGNRRFTSALLAICRKNAKSTLAAGIMLYCLCCEDEPGAQIISAATTGDQARVIWKIAKAMVEKTPDLREAYGLEPFANSIARWQTAASFKPINAKASTQDGLNPSHTTLDEVHAHKNHDLLNVLTSAAGARANALWLYTTTEGYESAGPWPELRLYAERLLQGIFRPEDTDHFFVIIYTLDDQIGQPGEPDYQPADDEFDESKWIKANPLIEVNLVLAKRIREHAAQAKQMPGQLAEFRIKRLNRRVGAANTLINLTKWKVCAEPKFDYMDLRGVKCWGGIDGASTTDLFSFRLVWLRDGVWFTKGWRWVPEEAVKQRTARGTVPYAGWVAAGLIMQTEGETVDHDVIEREIKAICDIFQPEVIAYDSWNLRDLVKRLKAHDIPLEEFRQGAKSYHPAMKAIEHDYIGGRLRHNGDPVLNWCASNLVPRYDDNLSMSPDRKRSADKIDDMAALYMARGAVDMVAEEEHGEPQLFFV